VKQKPGREMLEFCRDRQADVLRFTTDTSVLRPAELGPRPPRTGSRVPEPEM
jgi:hypothetical protein